MRAPPHQKIILRREIILIAQRIDALIFVKIAAIQFHVSGVAAHQLSPRAAESIFEHAAPPHLSPPGRGEIFVVTPLLTWVTDVGTKRTNHLARKDAAG